MSDKTVTTALEKFNAEISAIEKEIEAQYKHVKNAYGAYRDAEVALDRLVYAKKEIMSKWSKTL